MKSRWVLACALAALLALPATGHAAETPEAGAVFRLPGRQGEVASDSLRGRVVVIDFWASWCEPCRKSFPWLGSLQKKYGGRGLTVVGINLDKKRSAADAFLARFDAPFPVAFDPAGRTAESYRVAAMPTTVVLDREGRVIRRHAGFDPARTAEFETFLEEVLAR